ncbi:MAG: DUF4494 domain-containing protein [Bacteroidaceae bacterium]|nr:DUF4494 domain-containing protein [Bacteroidaceae bacterium]
MNNRYYETSVRFDKVMEDGQVKNVKETYVVDAYTFTEAEARIYDYLAGYQELDVFAIKRTKYEEILLDRTNVVCEAEAKAQNITGVNGKLSTTADRYYKVRLNFLLIDEATGKEKKEPHFYLVQANSVDAANEIIHYHMRGTLADYEVGTIDETKVIDVLIHQTEEAV